MQHMSEPFAVEGCFVYQVLGEHSVRAGNQPSVSDRDRIGLEFQPYELVSVDRVQPSRCPSTKNGPFLRLTDHCGWLYESVGGCTRLKPVPVTTGLWTWYVNHHPSMHVHGIALHRHPIDCDKLHVKTEGNASVWYRPMQRVVCDRRVIHPHTGISYYRPQGTAGWIVHSRLGSKPGIPPVTFLLEEQWIQKGLYCFVSLQNVPIVQTCCPTASGMATNSSSSTSSADNTSKKNKNKSNKNNAASTTAQQPQSASSTSSSGMILPQPNLEVKQGDMIIVDVIRKACERTHGITYLRLANGWGWLPQQHVQQQQNGNKNIVEQVPLSAGSWEFRVLNGPVGVGLRCQPTDRRDWIVHTSPNNANNAHPHSPYHGGSVNGGSVNSNSNGNINKDQQQQQAQQPQAVVYAYMELIQCDVQAIHPVSGVGFYRVQGTTGWLFDTRNGQEMLELLSSSTTNGSNNNNKNSKTKDGGKDNNNNSKENSNELIKTISADSSIVVPPPDEEAEGDDGLCWTPEFVRGVAATVDGLIEETTPQETTTQSPASAARSSVTSPRKLSRRGRREKNKNNNNNANNPNNKPRVLSFRTADGIRIHVYCKTRTVGTVLHKGGKQSCQRNCSAKDLYTAFRQDMVELLSKCNSNDNGTTTSTSNGGQGAGLPSNATMQNHAAAVAQEEELRSLLLECDADMLKLQVRKLELLSNIKQYDDKRSAAAAYFEQQSLQYQQHQQQQQQSASSKSQSSSAQKQQQQQKQPQQRDDPRRHRGSSNRRNDDDRRDDRRDRRDHDEDDDEDDEDSLSTAEERFLALEQAAIMQNHHAVTQEVVSVSGYKGRGAKCLECNAVFRTTQLRDEHCRKCHALYCDVCNKVFQSFEALDHHRDVYDHW